MSAASSGSTQFLLPYCTWVCPAPTLLSLGEVDLAVGTAPSEAYAGLLSCLHRSALEVARIKREGLPGLLEAVEDDLVITYTAEPRASAPLGRFKCGAWRMGGRPWTRSS